MEEISCPHCHHPDHQQRVGVTAAGSQRYRCALCQRKYTPQPQPRGYPEATRRQAIRLYVDGMGLRRIARHLRVVHQTVAHWVNAYAATLPDTPQRRPTTRSARFWSWNSTSSTRLRRRKKARLPHDPGRAIQPLYHRLGRGV